MGHDISLVIGKKKNPKFDKNKEVDWFNEIWLNIYADCFPVIGEGNYACDLVSGELVPKTMQNNLYITYNLSDIYYLALKNISRPDIESFGKFLNGNKAKKVLPVIEKMFDEIISKPEIYKPLEPEPDPETGERWGDFDSFCNKLYALIFACRKYPKATIYDSY